MSRTSIYVIGCSLEEITGVLRHATDAHDPLNFFEFDDGFPEKLPDGIVRATKNGAVAGYYAADLEKRLNELGLDVSVHSRLIRPHKGGRSVKKSTDVTPEVDKMLTELYKNYHISLGDIVDEAARAKYNEVKDG